VEIELNKSDKFKCIECLNDFVQDELNQNICLYCLYKHVVEMSDFIKNDMHRST
jgi:DNA-directed RNA polymerase subunit RPC12/RpoP